LTPQLDLLELEVLPAAKVGELEEGDAEVVTIGVVSVGQR